MATTVNVLINQIHRLRNSVNGNPRYLVETDHGPKITLADSSQWPESFAAMFSEDFDLARVLNLPAVLTLDKTGYIIGFAPVPTPGTPALTRKGKYSNDRDEQLHSIVSGATMNDEWEFGDTEGFGAYVWRYENQDNAAQPEGNWLIFELSSGQIVTSLFDSYESAYADFLTLRESYYVWHEATQ